MVQKRRTNLPEPGESSGSQEAGGGHGGIQRPPFQQPQQPLQPQQTPQQGGRGWGTQSGGYGGHAGTGRTFRLQYYDHRHGRGQPYQRGGSLQPGEFLGVGGHTYAGGPSRPSGPGLHQARPSYSALSAHGAGRTFRQQYYDHQHGRGQPYQRGSLHPGEFLGAGGHPSAGGPSRPSGPELHQARPSYSAVVAPQGPYGRHDDTLGGASSSSLAPSPVESEVTELMKEVSLQTEVAAHQQMQPASSKSMAFPLKRGKGSNGTKCIVKANHFSTKLSDKNIHRYDVTITPEVTSRGVNRAVISQLVRRYRYPDLDSKLPAYDGREGLYTAGSLPFVSKEFLVSLIDEEDGRGGARREREFNVVIRLAERPNLHDLEMLLQGRHADAFSDDAVKVYNIVLNELPFPRFLRVSRYFYSPNFGLRNPLGGGLESWRGSYQSIRPTQMGLSLNIDMSSTVFIEPLPVIDFVNELLDSDVSARTLLYAERDKIKNALKGVKVEVTHRVNMRRKYRVFGLTSQATRELTFPLDERGTIKSVVEYFRETYDFAIRHSQLPCLLVGNPRRPNYLPMEVCKIVVGQRYSKRLNENQITGLLKYASQCPREKESDILLNGQISVFENRHYAKEFGISISQDLTQVDARVLPTPRLKYHHSGRETVCLPSVGKWSMEDKKMFDGGTVNSWTCINFARSIQNNDAIDFCNEIVRMCTTFGMNFNPKPAWPVISVEPYQLEKVLKASLHDVMQKKELSLLIAILPDNNGSLYGDLKRICETELGIVSQCCLQKHVLTILTSLKISFSSDYLTSHALKITSFSSDYLTSLALKINVKVGGRNTVLLDAFSRRIPHVTDHPTIIFGASVTHPSPGDDSSSSIAAVVASQDWPEVTKYAGLVSAQGRQQVIQDLYTTWEHPEKGTMHRGMIRDLLLSFYKATAKKPHGIIFYRGGVSEGEFNQVLLFEVDAIRKACKSLEANYQPPITFVVVQKRHHTLLFPNNHDEKQTTDSSGNVLPGTIVDSMICHPILFDFYLCSHAGIQGTTSRPSHYTVLWDENKFTANALQSLTNNLCYTQARCTRAVSIVAPVYYAQLASYRARFYMEPKSSSSGSMTRGAAAGRGVGAGGSGSTSGRAANVAVMPLPQLHENVKKVMFFC